MNSIEIDSSFIPWSASLISEEYSLKVESCEDAGFDAADIYQILGNIGNIITFLLALEKAAEELPLMTVTIDGKKHKNISIKRAIDLFKQRNRNQ